MQSFHPTFLYIKRHTVTGKLYFGKTTKNPLSYRGSGKHWIRHIKIHGIDNIETLWYCLFTEREECNKFALMFSKQENIVESNNWLNLIPENGLVGGAQIISLETRQKISIAATGRKLSESTKAKLSIAAKGKSRPSTIYTEQWRQKQRESHIGRKDSEVMLKRKSIAQSGPNNPRAKTWILVDKDELLIEVKSLKSWCKERSFNSDSLTSTLHTGKFYKGFKVISKS
jgi:hypothetical protein